LVLLTKFHNFRGKKPLSCDQRTLLPSSSCKTKSKECSSRTSTHTKRYHSPTTSSNKK